MKKASEEPKETAKRGQKKQSISGQRLQREKEAAGAGLTGDCAEKPVSQSLDEKASISRADWLKVECDFRNVDLNEVEACCLYEYFRESAAMREALKPITLEPVSTDLQGRTEFKVVDANKHLMPLIGYREEDFYDYVQLRIALMKADFPGPWNRLNPNQRKELANVLAWRAKDKLKHPPLLVSELPLECFHDPSVQDEVLKRWWEKSYVSASFSDAESPETLEEFLKKGTFPYCDEHTYSYWLFRLDESYNETEAKEAFMEWFSKRYPKTKGGNRERWRAKLNDLVVMRLRKRFPGKSNLIRRVQHVAELTTAGFAGCKAYWNERQKARRGKREVEQGMSKAATEEMSRACGDALKFFQTYFPGEILLNY